MSRHSVLCVTLCSGIVCCAELAGADPAPDPAPAQDGQPPAAPAGSQAQPPSPPAPAPVPPPAPAPAPARPAPAEPSPAFADPTETSRATEEYAALSLEELLDVRITVASKTEATAATSPSLVTVLTKADIRRLGVRTLEELLNYVPGYQITPETTQGLYASYTVRGRTSSLSEHVLLLIDGQRINDMIYGSPSVLKHHIAIENIERVEIIRGPGSALYGSNAFLGVINVITNDESSFIWAGAGENQAAFGSVKFTEDHKDLHVSGFARVYTDNGTEYKHVTDAWGQTRTVRDPYIAGDLALAARYKGLELHLSHMVREQKGFLMWDTSQDRTASDTTHFSTARLDYALPLSSELKLLLSGQYSYTQWTSTGVFIPAGTQLGPMFTLNEPFRAGPYLTEQQAETSAELHWRPDNDNELIAGVSYGYGKLLKIGNYLDHKLPSFEPLGQVELFFTENTRWNSHDPRHIGGLYLQDQQDLSRFVNRGALGHLLRELYLTAGVRTDIYSDFGTTVNPRLAVVLKTPLESYIKLMYGRAFRAPTYSQLYNRANPVDRGNPDLSAEQINTYEAAYVQRIKNRLEATAAYYYYKITDAIVPDAPPLEDNIFGVPGWKNGGNLHAQGLECELRAQLFAGLSASGAYSFTHGANFDLAVAAHSASLAVNFNRGGFNANVNGIVRSEVDVPGLAGQGAYVLLNARVEHAVSDRMSVYLNLQNLTDNQYRTTAKVVPDGLPNRGRFILAGFILSL